MAQTKNCIILGLWENDLFTCAPASKNSYGGYGCGKLSKLGIHVTCTGFAYLGVMMI